MQFPTVSHPQTLERRYLGIINGPMLDLMKVRATRAPSHVCMLGEV